MEGRDPFDTTEDVASATECTGILPALPMDDAPDAQQSAAELYAIHAPRKTKEKRKRSRAYAKIQEGK